MQIDSGPPPKSIAKIRTRNVYEHESVTIFQKGLVFQFGMHCPITYKILIKERNMLSF